VRLTMKSHLIACLIGACLVAQAGEIDSPVPIPSPKGALTEGSNVRSIELHIDNQDAAIQYKLINKQSKNIDGCLTIYGPLFTWAGDDTTYSDKHFPELTVDLGSKPIKPTLHVVAFHDGIDVSHRLSALNIDPLRVALKSEARIPAKQINRTALTAALKDRLFTADGPMLIPNWYVQVSHTWPLSLEPDTSKSISIKYKLRPGFEPLRLSDQRLVALAAAHCATPEQLRTALQRDGQPLSEFVVAQTYQVPIGMGNATLPEEMGVEFIQSKHWAGLNSRASFACNGDGSGGVVIGTPSFKTKLKGLTDGAISILAILPQ
jgi:hypothetical protein